ncbi:MAG TPA: D-amino acid aminotransferase [Mariprofundaceae bacterium]|nr:D-amino acid aminotransferase [Mariprofundaceae bacterium]
MSTSQELIAWVNGRFTPLAEACVNIEDRGFQFADGVYEIIACFAGTFLDLDEHLERLANSCRAIELAMPVSQPELASLIRETYQRNPFDHAMLYVQITRGVSPRSHQIARGISPTLVITARHLPLASEEKISAGASAITLSDFRWQRCDIKSISLLASVMGRQEADRQNVDEAFWLDDAGYVLEGCSTNCFAVINQRLVTHPLDHRVLEGITRKIALRLAREHGLAVDERPWKLGEPGISEVFMTSTTSAAIPVCNIDGKSIADGLPGPVSLQVREWLLEHFRELRS